jgi:hypothetical protein
MRTKKWSREELLELMRANQMELDRAAASVGIKPASMAQNLYRFELMDDPAVAAAVRAIWAARPGRRGAYRPRPPAAPSPRTPRLFIGHTWDIDWSEAPIARRYGTYHTNFANPRRSAPLEEKGRK